jgi:hypothetical protein
MTRREMTMSYLCNSGRAAAGRNLLCAFYHDISIIGRRSSRLGRIRTCISGMTSSHGAFVAT